MKKLEAVNFIYDLLGARDGGKPREAFVDGANLVNDLGADSLDQIELLMAVEEECRIQIFDEEAEAVFGNDATVGSIAAWIETRTAAA